MAVERKLAVAPEGGEGGGPKRPSGTAELLSLARSRGLFSQWAPLYRALQVRIDRRWSGVGGGRASKLRNSRYPRPMGYASQTFFFSGVVGAGRSWVFETERGAEGI